MVFFDYCLPQELRGFEGKCTPDVFGCFYQLLARQFIRCGYDNRYAVSLRIRFNNDKHVPTIDRVFNKLKTFRHVFPLFAENADVTNLSYGWEVFSRFFHDDHITPFSCEGRDQALPGSSQNSENKAR